LSKNHILSQTDVNGKQKKENIEKKMRQIIILILVAFCQNLFGQIDSINHKNLAFTGDFGIHKIRMESKERIEGDSDIDLDLG
jgi:hypothetical protein